MLKGLIGFVCDKQQKVKSNNTKHIKGFPRMV